MKQVIARLRDCRTNSIKTIRRRYYYSQAQYEAEVYDDFKDIMPGQEIYIKFGNKFSLYITYEELMKNIESNEQDFDTELWYELVNSYSVDYFLKQYLSQY